MLYVCFQKKNGWGGGVSFFSLYMRTAKLPTEHHSTDLGFTSSYCQHISNNISNNFFLLIEMQKNVYFSRLIWSMISVCHHPPTFFFSLKRKYVPNFITIHTYRGQKNNMQKYEYKKLSINLEFVVFHC